jgi:mannosyltransferase OCH1-like enzyme
MPSLSSNENHRLNNNDSSSSSSSRRSSSNRKTNVNKETHYNKDYSNKGNKSTTTAVWLILVGCVIFGYVTNYHSNSKLLFHIIDYKDSAFSSSSAPQQQQQQQLSSKSLLSNQQQTPLLQLSELTQSHIQNIKCPEQLFPVYDKIINNNNNNGEQEQEQLEQLIPKNIHFSWKSRCISQDMMYVVDKWKEQFPSYNIYFHDDIAVAALINDNYWYDIFPQLKQIMNSCVKFGSAMTIDIWRILILYRYGGTYYIYT